MAEIKKKKKNTVTLVAEMAEPLAKELGLKVWDVNFVKEGADWFLRIFIDKNEGINIEDCVNMTHAINPILNETDPISHDYTLEVSSPGINRKLTKQDHFMQFLEAPVKVKLIRPMEDGKKEIEGILIDVLDNGDFELAIDEENTALFTKKECSSVVLLDDEM